MELIPVETVVNEADERLDGRSRAIGETAIRFKITIPTLYRWLKDGDHFLADDGEVESVFKLVKCNEKDQIK